MELNGFHPPRGVFIHHGMFLLLDIQSKPTLDEIIHYNHIIIISVIYQFKDTLLTITNLQLNSKKIIQVMLKMIVSLWLFLWLWLLWLLWLLPDLACWYLSQHANQLALVCFEIPLYLKLENVLYIFGRYFFASSPVPSYLTILMKIAPGW